MEGEPPARTYGGAGVSEETKAQTVMFALALLNSGVSKATVLSSLENCPYRPSKSALNALLVKARRGEPLFSPTKKQGRPPDATAEQWEICAGWILDRNKKVDYYKVANWMEVNLGVRPHPSTISRHLSDLKLSVQLTGSRPMPENMTRDEYVSGYHAFLLELDSAGFWVYDHSKILCVDFVTNSRRRERETTINLVGAPQKKLAGTLPQFTHSYMVAVTYGGKDDYKPIMFTHQEALSPHGSNGARVRKLLKKFGLDDGQIVYVESGKKYCKEAQWQVGHFKSVYRSELAGTRVLADQGGSFKIGGEFILADGANMYYSMPSAQHGQMSVLDNKLNAVAKALWRAERTSSDFIYDDILLLRCLQRVGQDSISSWWESNFLIKKGRPTLQDVEDMLGSINGKAPIHAPSAQWYKARYTTWKERAVEQDCTPITKKLKSTLDGAAWKK